MELFLAMTEATPCCGQPPTLRVRPRIVFTTRIAYVQFECSTCHCKGGLAITEAEALAFWNEVAE